MRIEKIPLEVYNIDTTKGKENPNTRKGKTMTIATNLLEKLNEARNNENAIKYMKGYYLTNGRAVARYEVTLIDIDIATATATVFSEVDGNIKIEYLKREQLIYRVA